MFQKIYPNWKVFTVILTASCISLFSTQMVYSTTYPDFFIEGNGDVAVFGKDVTSFFDDESILQGDPSYTAEYKGVKWQFANSENMEKFKQNPEKYMPQYDGWCVWAISHGRMRGGLTQFSYVHDGKLYLLCNKLALERFRDNPDFHIKRADKFWEQLKSLQP